MLGESSKRKKLLSVDEIDEAVAELARAAKLEGVRVALHGGVAMQFYGSPRLTSDVDILADDEIMSLPNMGHLTFGGQKTCTSNGAAVDVIVRSDDWADLYEAALDTAGRIKGVPMRVVRPEYMAAIKMAAHRPKDQDDLAFLITEGLDLKKTRRVVSKYLGRYAAMEFDSLAAEAFWRKKRETPEEE